MPPRIVVALIAISFLVAANAHAQSQQHQQRQNYQPAGLEAPPTSQTDLFEASLGFNYIHLDDQYPETKHLYGFETSLFVNATSWLAVGGEFMAGFGSRSIPYFFNRTLDVDSTRYIYVFGPRITVWRDQKFRVFVEALGGGAHAEANVSTQSPFAFSRTATANSVAGQIGAGFDWRVTDHVSWRILQADYIATNLGNDWQNNFRATTAIVYFFGRK